MPEIELPNRPSGSKETEEPSGVAAAFENVRLCGNTELSHLCLLGNTGVWRRFPSNSWHKASVSQATEKDTGPRTRVALFRVIHPFRDTMVVPAWRL